MGTANIDVKMHAQLSTAWIGLIHDTLWCADGFANEKPEGSLLMKNIRHIALVTSIAASFICNAALSNDSNIKSSAQLLPLRALTVDMQDFTAVIYYVISDAEEYEVVITIGPNINVSGTITQHRTTISAGQSYTLSFDQGVGKDSVQHLKINAGHDVLRVSGI